MVSQFREVLTFFDDLGVYDVILPFLLVFTIVFAILEKTKVFGVEMIDGKPYTKKNLNSITSFVIAFFVIASSRMVETITEVSANMVVLLMLAVFFLILVGSFYKQGEDVALEKGWRYLFMGIMFVGIVAIFLWAIKKDDGTPWLQWFWDYIKDNFDSTAVGSIVLMLILIGFLWLIVWGPKGSETVAPSSTPSSPGAPRRPGE
jgi:hypothetical protein